MHLLLNIRFSAKCIFSCFLFLSVFFTLRGETSPGFEVYALLQKNQIADAEKRLFTLHHKTGKDVRQFNQALLHYYKKDYQLTLSELKAVANFNDIGKQAYLLKSLTLWRLDNPQEALYVLENLALDPVNEREIFQFKLFLLAELNAYERASELIGQTTDFNLWNLFFLVKTEKCASDLNKLPADWVLSEENAAMLISYCTNDFERLKVLASFALAEDPKNHFAAYLYWSSFEKSENDFFQKMNAYRTYTGTYGKSRSLLMIAAYAFIHLWIYILIFITLTFVFFYLRRTRK